jgi:SAM-dependent methyltransferase
MEMGETQQNVLNSRFRQLFHRYYEFGVIKKHLRTNQVDLAGKVVLDAGCGSGFGTQVILEDFQPQEVHALDALPEQIELVEQRELPVDACIGDIADTQFETNKFDAIFAFGLFHHVPDWQQAIVETKRILKPGGVLMGNEITKKDHANGFKWESFRRALVDAGFQVLEDEGIYLGFFRSFVCVNSDPSADAPAKTRQVNRGAEAARWILLTTLVFMAILLPFFLFESQIEAWTKQFIDQAAQRPGLVALVLGGLLASDIVLPIPSSLTSTATGLLLGFVRGLLVSLAGMTISCIIGYWLGRRLGRPVASRIVGNDGIERLEELSQRVGNWAIVIARPHAGRGVGAIRGNKPYAAVPVPYAVHPLQPGHLCRLCSRRGTVCHGQLVPTGLYGVNPRSVGSDAAGGNKTPG